MSTLLARGQALLAAKGKAAAGVAVEFRTRRLVAPLALTAWVGKAERLVRAVDGAAAVLALDHDREYLVAAADLPGRYGPPAPGDRFTEAGETYEVVTETGPLPPWEWADSGRTIYRVRTKRKFNQSPGCWPNGGG